MYFHLYIYHYQSSDCLRKVNYYYLTNDEMINIQYLQNKMGYQFVVILIVYPLTI